MTEIIQFADLIKTKSAKQVLTDFTESQKQKWPLAAANFKGLEWVEERSFQFGEFQIRAQFNPERIRSSVANVDKASIEARTCFLCSKNRPKEQDAIGFDDQYEILVNPFPIFRNHFTISSNIHTDQRFFANAQALLDLAKAMEGFTVFYNGPECGASAPDHLHFQAGESEFLPLTNEFLKLRKNKQQLIFSGMGADVFAFDNYLRNMISIVSNSKETALKIIESYYCHFSAMQPEKAEPMMNALCNFADGKWNIHLFPRKAHRPWQFFAEAEKQILISPGSVDFGGVFILPRREDFDKITSEDVIDILNQVCVNQDTFLELAEKIRNDLSKFV